MRAWKNVPKESVERISESMENATLVDEKG
jgi:hypothetical protein